MAYEDIKKIIEEPNYQIYVDDNNPKNSDSPQDVNLIQSMHDKHADKFKKVIELFESFNMDDDATSIVKYYQTSSDLPSTGNEEVIYLIGDAKEVRVWDNSNSQYVLVGAGSSSDSGSGDTSSTPTTNITYINSNTTVTSTSFIICDTTGGTITDGSAAYTITLDSNLPDKTVLIIMDGNGNAENRPPEIASSESIYLDGSLVTDFSIKLDINYFKTTLIYDASNNAWHLGNNK